MSKSENEHVIVLQIIVAAGTAGSIKAVDRFGSKFNIIITHRYEIAIIEVKLLIQTAIVTAIVSSKLKYIDYFGLAFKTEAARFHIFKPASLIYQLKTPISRPGIPFGKGVGNRTIMRLNRGRGYNLLSSERKRTIYSNV
ncbi:hypothetical protein D3C73_794330 [compost metagenome]